jgi:hypothetical protein
MPGIELSRLSGPDIRRLLSAAEERDQQDLAKQLRAELVARRGRGPTMEATRAGMPTPAPRFEERFETANGGRLKGTLLAVAAVAVVAIGAGWVLERGPSRPAAPEAAVAAATTPIPPRPVAAPVAAMPVVPSAEPAPPVPALKVVAQRAPVTKPAKAAKAKVAPRPEACRSNRVICSSPQLMAQEQRMRRAYDQALAAGADPLAVDEAQARWRTTLAKTASRTGAAQLYEQRIRELEAAARAANR